MLRWRSAARDALAMRAHLFHLFAWTTLLSLGANAWGADLACPRIEPDIHIDISEPSYNYDFDAASLSRYSSKRKNVPGRQVIVTGFYEAPMTLLAQVQFKIREHGEPAHMFSSCINRLAITIKAWPNIQVANELRQGGCGHDAVSAHEYNHHRIHMAQLREALPVYLQLNPLPSTAFFSSTDAQVSYLINAYTQAYVDTMGQSIENFIQPAQKAFDSPTEYRRIQNLCPAEFQAMRAKYSSR
jgi:hypothetical protein